MWCTIQNLYVYCHFNSRGKQKYLDWASEGEAGTGLGNRPPSRSGAPVSRSCFQHNPQENKWNITYLYVLKISDLIVVVKSIHTHYKNSHNRENFKDKYTQKNCFKSSHSEIAINTWWTSLQLFCNYIQTGWRTTLEKWDLTFFSVRVVS